MKKNLLTLFSLILLVGTSCQEKIELTDTQRKEIADNIRNRTQEWLNTIKEANQENLDMFLDFWVETDEASWMDNPALWVSNLDIVPTRKKMEDFWRPIIDERSSHDLKIVKDYISVLSADQAIHVFKANYRITDAEGNIGEEHTCVMTNVYVRKNDVWKILHHHQSYE